MRQEKFESKCYFLTKIIRPHHPERNRSTQSKVLAGRRRFVQVHASVWSVKKAAWRSRLLGEVCVNAWRSETFWGFCSLFSAAHAQSCCVFTNKESEVSSECEGGKERGRKQRSRPRQAETSGTTEATTRGRHRGALFQKNHRESSFNRSDLQKNDFKDVCICVYIRPRNV